MKSLIEHESPLYGRIDLALELKPMDYFDAAKFYPAFSPEDKVRLYSVFGGIPFTIASSINPKAYATTSSSSSRNLAPA